jgi:vacuolar iron transporter family protein
MKLNHSLKTGFSFGLTSGIITTLGLMVGLSAGTHSKLVVIGGILTIAIADAFSDALGIHVSEESEGKHTTLEIWQSTIATFISKFTFALTFIVPVLLLGLTAALWVSIAWGLSVLGLLSYQMGREEQGNPWQVVLEHLLIAVVVIFLTHYVGLWISKVFS